MLLDFLYKQRQMKTRDRTEIKTNTIDKKQLLSSRAKRHNTGYFLGFFCFIMAGTTMPMIFFSLNTTESKIIS